MTRILQGPLHEGSMASAIFVIRLLWEEGKVLLSLQYLTMVQYSLPTPTSFSCTDLPYCDFLSPLCLCWNLCEKKVLKIKNLLGLALVYKVSL